MYRVELRERRTCEKCIRARVTIMFNSNRTPKIWRIGRREGTKNFLYFQCENGRKYYGSPWCTTVNTKRGVEMKKKIIHHLRNKITEKGYYYFAEGSVTMTVLTVTSTLVYSEHSDTFYIIRRINNTKYRTVMDEKKKKKMN